jgi:uncharacterized protein YjbI with pentapeptide repeats
MPARRDDPAPPRTWAPDIPRELSPRSGLSPREDIVAARIGALTGDVSGAHGRIAESLVEQCSLDRLDLTGTALTDVTVTGVRAVSLLAREGSWRNVELVEGRVATVDALRVQWESVVLRDMHIDYLALPSAELTDIRIIGCTIGTLDLPEARLTRVRIEDSRVDEVDTRGMRCRDADLRGLEALAYTDPRGLDGAVLTPQQAESHGASFARALRVRVIG